MATTTMTSVPSDSRFWDRMAEKYAKKPVPDEAVYQRKLDITRRYLTPESNVVEIGGGTGSTALAHAPYVNRVLSTDISPKMIEIARAKAAEAGVANVDFEVASIDELSVAPNSVDAVLGLSILHLVRDIDAAIGKAAAMLKPGGVFVTSTACIADGMRWFGLIAPVGRYLGLFPYINILSANDIRQALQRHGFESAEEWQPDDGRTLFHVARKIG